MAKNWKVGEAVKAVKSGNKADILDIGRRFPLFANLAAQLNDAGVQLLDCIPEYVSARKLESVLKGDVQPTEEEEETEVEEEKPAKKKAPAKNTKTKASKKAEAEEEDEYAGKSAKELYDMCKDAGLKVKPKQTKDVYVEALKSANENEEDDDWGDEEEEAPKKPAKKPAKKKAPKKEVEEDDDDDWEV